MRRYRVAIAGLGEAARRIHLPAYSGLENVEVVGGADPSSTHRFRFPVFPSVEEMIAKTHPDVIAVLAPPDDHASLSRLALNAGCHVLCEKPLVPTLQEADDLAALSRRVARRLVVNQEYRFMRIHSAAKALIGQADFGELLFLSAEQTFVTTQTTEEGWRGADPERTCKEFGIHVLDLCRFFFGEEPVGVTASMPRPGAAGGPDLLNLIRLDFAGQRTAHITLDRLSKGRHRYLAMRLDGTAGAIETEIGGGVELSAGVHGRTRRPYVRADVALGGRARLFRGERFRKIASDPLDLFASATRRLVASFLGALDRDETPPCDVEDNRKSLALVRAAYESSRLGGTVVP